MDTVHEMNFIETELEEIRKIGEHVVLNCKLVSCVRTMVRAEIKFSAFKTVIICIQFTRDYPKEPLLLELKSKTISDQLLAKLTDVCEQEIKKILGKPQILTTLKFISNFIYETPLCCCYDEINNLKKLLMSEDELKLKQKTSSISLKIVEGQYFVKLKILIPECYPDKYIILEDAESNFPSLFCRFMVAQSKELARKCIEPPKIKKHNEPKFKPKPSLEIAIAFLIDCVKQIPSEKCQICKQLCFPDDPTAIETDEKSPRYIERTYCGHLFHNQCLISYMKKPPFGNKQCPSCKKKIYHEKWNLSDKLAEDRWVHEQARERELAEVTEFFE